MVLSRVGAGGLGRGVMDTMLEETRARVRLRRQRRTEAHNNVEPNDIAQIQIRALDMDLRRVSSEDSAVLGQPDEDFICQNPVATLERDLLRVSSVSVEAAFQGAAAADQKASWDVLVAEEGELLECSICLDSEAECPGIQRVPTCPHSFHKDCIEEWQHSCELRQEEFTCPDCRRPLPDDIGLRLELDKEVDSIELGEAIPYCDDY